MLNNNHHIIQLKNFFKHMSEEELQATYKSSMLNIQKIEDKIEFKKDLQKKNNFLFIMASIVFCLDIVALFLFDNFSMGIAILSISISIVILSRNMGKFRNDLEDLNNELNAFKCNIEAIDIVIKEKEISN